MSQSTKQETHLNPVKKVKKMYSSLPILDQVYRAGSGRKNNDEENTNVSRPK
jgi:hypothetical protein